jgi:RimJ/RimL family protein N-acetyltransferase
MCKPRYDHLVLRAATAPMPEEQLDRGEVTLRRLQIGDREAIRRWMADPSLIRFTVLVPGPEYGPVLPYPHDAADRYLETLVADPTRRSFAVELDGHHVGNIGLKEYDPSRPSTECFIEIGERGLRGAGVGHCAMHLLLDLAFHQLRLEEVRLGVFEFNHPALRLYRRLGFADAGRYGWHWAEGRYWEVLAMTMRADRWAALRDASAPRGAAPTLAAPARPR